jgi:hypothetical protein
VVVAQSYPDPHNNANTKNIYINKYIYTQTGVDVDRMRDILGELSFEKILSFPEMSRFIDQDAYLSKVLRS